MLKKLVAVAALWLGATAQVSQAENIYDPLPPLNWNEMNACELVVVAKYETHQTEDTLREGTDQTSGLTHDKKQTLTLHIDRVLHGQGVKAGDSLRVDLRHWYTIETRPVQDFTRQTMPSDGVPRLCYKDQPSNPGGLEPFQITPDVRADVLYFFPQAASPALERLQQVQPLDLEAGWQSALDKRPIALPFRLAQQNSPQVSRDALEELGASRDAATLDLLFDSLQSSPPSLLSRVAPQVLKALGDRNGDVYHRAYQRLWQMPRDWVPYAKMTPVQKSQNSFDQPQGRRRIQFSTCAQLMAEVDGERAARDFERWIHDGPPGLREMAGNWLGFTYSENALNGAFELLKKPETAEMGADALRSLLRPTDLSARSSRNRARQTAHLLELAKPRLARALASPVFDASRTEAALAINAPSALEWMRLNREALEKLLIPETASAPLDLAHARQVLLHPDAKTFAFGSFGRGNQWIENEGTILIRAIDQAADPRFIPLLVTMLREVSPALQNGDFQGMLRRYVVLYPNAFRREMRAQGLTPEFYNASALHGQGFDSRVLAMLGNPSLVWMLGFPSLPSHDLPPDDNNAAWIKRYAASPALLSEIAASIGSELDSQSHYFQVERLRFLLIADPTAARPLLERALQGRGNYQPRAQASLLALGVANGHAELLDELLGLSRVLAQQKHEPSAPTRDFSDAPGWDASVLLWAYQPRATQEFLQILDQGIDGATSVAAQLDDEPLPYSLIPTDTWLVERTQALFPDHRSEFFQRVLRLLRSTSISQRETGQRMLQNLLGWSLGFDAQDLKSERDAELQSIAPLFQRLSAATEAPMRALLLQELGVVLPSSAPMREAKLLQLMSASDGAISQNAERLLQLTSGDDEIESLSGLPAPQKALALGWMRNDRARAEL